MNARIIHRMLIFAALMSIPRLCGAADTVPPRFSWLWPEPFAVITTDSPRLCVDARDEGGSGVASVKFFARYFDYKGRPVEREFVGEVDTPPYEYIWDCSHIPDQNFGKLVFYCEVTDRAGNTAVVDEHGAESVGRLVLDRNRDTREDRLISHFTGREITVDGSLGEWTSADSVVIINNDNRIGFYSQWDRKRLYFAVVARGKSVISHFPPGSGDIDGMPTEDVVELYLDPDHDHDEIFHYPDRHFLVAAGGMVYERLVRYGPAVGSYLSEVNLDPGIRAAVVVEGTLNDDTDEDIGYTMEIGIPWDELGCTPRDGFSMGLELWNNDKDFIDGNYFYAGWTTTASNVNNPSEWGNLVCAGGGVGAALITVVVAVIFVLLGGGITAAVAARRGKSGLSGDHAPHPDVTVEESEYVRKAKEYIGERFTDESLSREEVAETVGLTPSYFGKVFSKETGMSFTDYLASVRIEKAKELLATTQKNISEIALEVGFASQSYFGYLFRKKEKKSPKEYRSLSR